MNENVTIKGKVVINIGNRIFEELNLVVTNGLYQLVKAAAGGTTDMPQAVAVGTGTTAPALGDVELESEVDREAFSESPTNPTNTSVKYKALFPAEQDITFTELGLFSSTADNSGTMFSRTITSEKTKDSTEEMEITWTITISNE